MSLKEGVKKVFGRIANEINATIGYKQSFTELLENKDVTRAIGMMEKHSERSEHNLLEYNTETHKVMSRPKKTIYDKNGNFIRNKDVNRIAIPYHKFINEIALVFIYGRPVLWSNATPNPRKDERQQLQALLDQPEHDQSVEDTIAEIDLFNERMDDKFSKLVRQLKNSRFDAHLREAKRYAGCEGCSAMLFHTYQEDGVAKMLIRVLAKSKNDDIYTLFDQYDRLMAFAWGYTTLDAKNKSVYQYNIYTKETVYLCKNVNGGGWEVEVLPNVVGKIPVIVFEQEVEWEGAQTIIERIEDAYSHNADSNDNFADPALVATSDIVNTLPKQEEESRLYVLKNGGDIKYLERSNANQARQDEIDALDEQAMNKTFTPNITLEELKGLSNASGATLRQIMMLATIKADKRKETHDGYLSRVSSLMKAIMGNVLDVASGSYDELVIEHEFQEPFGADLTQLLDDALKQYSAGALSMKTLLEKSYIVPNADKEMDLIKKDQAVEDERKKLANISDIFETAI